MVVGKKAAVNKPQPSMTSLNQSTPAFEGSLGRGSASGCELCDDGAFFTITGTERIKRLETIEYNAIGDSEKGTVIAEFTTTTFKRGHLIEPAEVSSV
ncbi:hypothetical protein QOT17_004820 [Balamuthia mandrillaris]